MSNKAERLTALEQRRVPVFIGVTGHREFRGSDDRNSPDMKALRSKVAQVLTELRRKYDSTEFVILTALAQGADQVVAEVAVELEMRFAAVLPMPFDKYINRRTYDSSTGELRDDFDHAAKMKAYELCESEWCEFVYTIPYEDGVNDNNVTDPTSTGAADKQFAETARFISDNSFVQLALWDGKCGMHDTAGTGAAVRDSLHGRGYSRYRPNGLNIPETRPIYHIYTPRKGAQPKPYDFALRRLYPEPLLETGSKWFTVDAFSKLDRGWSAAQKEAAIAALFDCKVQRSVLPREAKKVIDAEKGRAKARGKACEEQLRRIDIYNSELVKKYIFISNTEKRYGLELDRTDETTKQYEEIFNDADRLALWYRDARKWGGVGVIAIAGIAYMMLNIYSDLLAEWIFLAAYIMLMAVALVMYLLITKKGLHQRYVDYRTLAEGLRVQGYWYRAGIADKPEDYNPTVPMLAYVHNYYLRKQKSEIEWIRTALRNWNLRIANDNCAHVVDKTVIDDVCARWLGIMDIPDKNDPTKWVAAELASKNGKLRAPGQSAYYKKKTTDTAKRAHIFGAITSALITLAFIIAVLLLANDLMASKLTNVPNFWQFMAGLLPVGAMVSGAISQFIGYEQDTGRNRWYHMVFKRAVVELDGIEHDGSLCDKKKIEKMQAVLFDIGKEELQENADWAALNADRAPQIPS